MSYLTKHGYHLARKRLAEVRKTVEEWYSAEDITPNELETIEQKQMKRYYEWLNDWEREKAAQQKKIEAARLRNEEIRQCEQQRNESLTNTPKNTGKLILLKLVG